MLTGLPLMLINKYLAVAYVQSVRQVSQSDTMKSIVIGEEYNPGAAVKFDEDILEFIKNNIMGIFNPATTCNVGFSDDSMAILGSQARVYGVTGLRIMNASSFPFLPPGHPQATVCRFSSFYPGFENARRLTLFVDMLVEKIAA